MTRNELKAIVAKHPGWATCVVYGNNHNSIRLLYGDRYVSCEHTRIPELDDVLLNPNPCCTYPVGVDFVMGDAPDYRVYIPDEWGDDYSHLPSYNSNI